MASLVNEPYFENSFATIAEKRSLWRTYRCDNEVGTLPKANIPTELEWRIDLHRFRIKSGMTMKVGILNSPLLTTTAVGGEVSRDR